MVVGNTLTPYVLVAGGHRYAYRGRLGTHSDRAGGVLLHGGREREREKHREIERERERERERESDITRERRIERERERESEGESTYELYV